MPNATLTLPLPIDNLKPVNNIAQSLSVITLIPTLILTFNVTQNYITFIGKFYAKRTQKCGVQQIIIMILVTHMHFLLRNLTRESLIKYHFFNEIALNFSYSQKIIFSKA